MRHRPVLTALFLCIAALRGQEPAAPAQSPNDVLRGAIRQWVETMKQIQKEEDDWERDREVLENYREGLRKEIEELKDAIASAKDRKAGAEKESLEKVARRDAFATAKARLATAVRELEQESLRQAQRLPAVLLAEPKTAQVIEDIRSDCKATGDREGESLARRINNVLTLLGEAEKFQQTVHLRDELHKRADGAEFNLKMVYFGLAAAYGVNEGGDFAVVGKPGTKGWTCEERPDLAPRIKRLVDSTNGDIEAVFVPLPIQLP